MLLVLDGRPFDADRVDPPDQVGRAVLVGTWSTEINGMNVIPNALAGVLVQVIDRPAGRHADRITAELDDLPARLGGLCRLGSLYQLGGLYRLDVRGKAGAGHHGLMPRLR